MSFLKSMTLFCSLCCSYLFLFNTAQAIPMLHLDAHSQDGKKIGKHLAQQIKQQFPYFERDYDQYLADTIADYDWADWAARADQVRNQVPQRLREEIDVLAQRLAQVNKDQLGDGHLSAREFWVIQILLEHETLSEGVGFGVLKPASDISGPMLGYNLNGFNHPALLRLRAITVYQSDSPVINIGFAGFIGVLMGYNSSGLFVAYQPSAQPIIRMDHGQKRYSIALHLRMLLEDNDRITQTLPGLVFQKFFTSHNLFMGDNRTVQVLEQSRQGDTHLRLADSPLQVEMQWQRPEQIATVDCFASRGAAHNCSNSRDITRWYRLRDLAQFSPQQPASINDIQEVLLDQQHAPYQSIFTENTLYGTVFLPLERRLFLYTKGSLTYDNLPVFQEVEVSLPHRYTLENVPTYQKVSIVGIFISLLGILLLNLWRPMLKNSI